MGEPERIFDGQLALVTGGGTGLGLAISRGLCERGASVVIASRHAEHHRALLEEARGRGWEVEAIVLDLLVNNAAGNFLCPAERLSARAWRSVLGIVLDGTFFCSRYFGRGMIERGRGRILNIVATYAWTGMPGVVHSTSAKAGVLALTRTLAVEWARFGLRVNAIAPGPFDTPGAAERLWPEEGMRERIEAQVPLGRLARVEEVAVQCIHLLAQASDYVNGACLVVDGGLSLGRNMWAPGETRRPRPRS